MKKLNQSEKKVVAGGRLVPESQYTYPKTPVTLDPRAPVDGIYPPPQNPEM